MSLSLCFFLSRLLSYCLSSKHSWLIWPWGPGLPASLRVSPSLTQLKPAGIAQHWESLLMNLQLYQTISFQSLYLPPFPQKGGGGRINQSLLSQWHTPSWQPFLPSLILLALSMRRPVWEINSGKRVSVETSGCGLREVKYEKSVK